MLPLHKTLVRMESQRRCFIHGSLRRRWLVLIRSFSHPLLAEAHRCVGPWHSDAITPLLEGSRPVNHKWQILASALSGSSEERATPDGRGWRGAGEASQTRGQHLSLETCCGNKRSLSERQGDKVRASWHEHRYRQGCGGLARKERGWAGEGTGYIQGAWILSWGIFES